MACLSVSMVTKEALIVAPPVESLGEALRPWDSQDGSLQDQPLDLNQSLELVLTWSW